MNYFGDLPIPEVAPFVKNLGDRDPLIRRADQFQEQVHFGQMRHIVRESHSAHTRYVAAVYFTLFGDAEGTCAGLLHDTKEDSPKLARYIGEKFRKFLRHVSPQSFTEFVHTHVPECFQEFLKEKPYEFTFPQQNGDGTISTLPEDSSAQHRFLGIIYGASTGELFRHFVANKVKEFGSNIDWIVRLLTSTSDGRIAFNKAFRDERIPRVLRVKAANLKGIDTYHNSETLNLKKSPTPAQVQHAEELFDRTIEFLPYVQDLMDERIYNPVMTSLTARYEELLEHKPYLPSLTERLIISERNFRDEMGMPNRPFEARAPGPGAPSASIKLEVPIAASLPTRRPSWGGLRANLHHLQRRVQSSIRRRFGYDSCDFN
jgi:hypothetical protein